MRVAGGHPAKLAQELFGIERVEHSGSGRVIPKQSVT